MNNCLIDGVVHCLENSQLSIEEAIKKAWYLDLTIKGIYPTEKELNTIQRKVIKGSYGIWRLSCQ